jgi:glutamine amidotransferase-like uncharacterized protein
VQTIAVYNNGRVSTGSLTHRLKMTFPRHRLLMVTTADIVERDILSQPGIEALFMPGVQDHKSSYRDDVTPEGWRRVREYIERGGAYVGICAGAYLATARFRYFDTATGATRNLHSPLAVFEGVAVGPIPQYTNPNGERHKWAEHAVARLAFNEAAGYKGEGAACYSLGPYLTLPPEIEKRADYKIIARFADVPGAPIALASRRLGKGVAVFSGVVPEISGQDMESFERQYTVQAYRQDADVRAGFAFARALAAEEAGRARVWDAIVSEIKRAGPASGPGPAR